MIDVSFLMTDPDFASRYQVLRRTGRWEEGRFVLGEPETLQFYGPVQPASVKELEQVPEADRQKGIMTFWCKEPKRFCLTHGGQDAGPSDVVLWQGERYKIFQLMPWNHMGWMQAFGYRMEVSASDGAKK